MTIQECYQVVGGDYAQVEKRLPGIHLIRKFIAKFLDDGSYPELCRAMEQGQTEEAFRAAHTLKGVSANLGFDRLTASSGELTELLQGRCRNCPADPYFFHRQQLPLCFFFARYRAASARSISSAEGRSSVPHRAIPPEHAAWRPSGRGNS